MSPNNDTSELQQRAVALIKPLIPPDAKDRVAQAIKQFNQAVRAHIRSETGLRLSDDEERGAVPISMVEGFPTGVARLIDVPGPNLVAPYHGAAEAGRCGGGARTAAGELG